MKEKKQKEQKEQKPQLIQSETVIIKRSRINFAPYNPKKHTEEGIKAQVKNFKSKGFFGGIIWNETTGNLVAGHKRIMAMDRIFKNTEETPVDYDVKVEKVKLSLKAEMEQNVWMDSRSTNTAQDLGLLAEIFPEIDPKEAGLDEVQIGLLVAENPNMDLTSSEEAANDFEKIEKSYEERKQAVKDMKAQIKDNVIKDQQASYVTLSFDSYEHKAQFLETLGYDADTVIVKGELFYEKLQENPM